jgi:hypothetical protein
MREQDKRHFTRYTKDSLCEVTIDTVIHKGKVVDYSDGVGVLIKKIPQLVQGAVVDIRILDCELEFGAEVAWTEEFGYHLRAGFRRLGNLKGNLKHYRLVDILSGLGKSRKTGILEIIVGSTVKKIFINKGIKIFAVSSNTNDRLGESLLTQGKITLEEYNQASYLVKKTGKRLGQVLIDLGYMKAGDLAPSVQHQMEEIIIGLFNIDEGQFVFKEGGLPKDEPIKLRISTANLIYNGIKRINSFPMVDKMCPSLETVFNLSQNPTPLFRSLTLEYADKKLLSHVNGMNSLKTLLSLSHTRNFETLKTIISLLTIGLITVKGENEAPVKPPLEVIFGKPVETPEVEIADELHDEEAEIGAGIAEETTERQSIFDSHRDIPETPKELEPIIDVPNETPLEELAEGKHDEEAAVIATGIAEEAAERQSIVDSQKEVPETPKEQEPIIDVPDETPVEEIAEEKHDEEAAVFATGIAKEAAERQSIVDSQKEVPETPKEQEPIIDVPDETPVEEIAEEKHEEETAEETAEQKSITDTRGEMTEISKEEEAVTEELDMIPVEKITEELDEEQPVADTVSYVKETSGIPEPVAMHTDMSSEARGIGYVKVNDMTAEKTTAEFMLDADQPTADIADVSEKSGAKKKWVISTFIIIILIGAIIPFVYEDIKTYVSPPDATTIQNTESLKSFRDKALEKATAGITEDKVSFPTFREDALKKLLNE